MKRGINGFSTTKQNGLAAKLQDFFGLKRNIVVLSLAMFIAGFGTQLWTRFMPKYLEALGASAFIIGVYGSLRNALITTYRYPEGVMVDKLGRRVVEPGDIYNVNRSEGIDWAVEKGVQSGTSS